MTNADDAVEYEAETPSEPIPVTSPNHFEEVLSENDVVLVDFYATWCGPCKMIEPVVEELAAETPAAVAKIDVDQQRALAAEYGVQGVPTLMLFDEGTAAERLVGVREKSHYAQLIEQYAE